ncbi:methyl-accepting chemotaxis protein [Treponema phagedenis]|uniref:methyl-accepting chemotaxis protein n=1 Tax=Treponema phagedenis TaxID=162 RepID=UPI0004654BC9|nr:methyl-accepting chemotaxis protein [Treponema phagedenis]
MNYKTENNVPYTQIRKKTKRFSIRNKILLVCSCLVFLSCFFVGSASVLLAQRMLANEVNAHFINHAATIAKVLNARLNVLIQFLDGIGQMPQIRDRNISFPEKMLLLREERDAYNQKTKRKKSQALQNDVVLQKLWIVDAAGYFHSYDGSLSDMRKREWYTKAIPGTIYVSSPYISRTTREMVITISLPVYDGEQKIIGVIAMDVEDTALSNEVKDILVGNKGYCYVVDSDGTIIAHKDIEKVSEKMNIFALAESDNSFASAASFIKQAIQSETPTVDVYKKENILQIASSARMHTGWTIVVTAPYSEFMGVLGNMKRTLFFITAGIIATALLAIILMMKAIMHSIQQVVTTLQNISRGDGDLTVSLPLIGNDEMTDLSQYFNETIKKIRDSVDAVNKNTITLKEVGVKLSTNMTETASAVNQINSNINGVKQQTLTQAASVAETAATVEEIVRTIKQLNGSIESQATSVAESASSIEQMVSNIASITQILEKANIAIKELASATADGKDTIVTSNHVMQQIANESGGLLEASSIIQHIASQTNLLAMNAAIEAAHAGDSGKGFAVVADEIRKLAEESSTQGKNITTTLKTLSGEIETLSISSQTVKDKFNAIFELSGQVKDTSNRLMEAMQEQKQSGIEVLSAIKEINNVTVQVKNGSAEMLTGGESVALEMQKLDELTRLITDSMDEMASGAIQINNAVQEVNEITQKNKESIEKLANEVKKFKV